jgi:hypothetical protein
LPFESFEQGLAESPSHTHFSLPTEPSIDPRPSCMQLTQHAQAPSSIPHAV